VHVSRVPQGFFLDLPAVGLNLSAWSPRQMGMRIRKAQLSFEDFVHARSTSLLRTAYLLAGQNRAEAEDLLQLALERAYRNWDRVCRANEPEGYVRAILATTSADRWRRVARRAEQPLFAAGAGPAVPDQTAAIDDHDYLMRALARLAPRQRAVLVLRYLDDLSEVETARMLGCSVGSVKSQAARGLARLRELTSPDGSPQVGRRRLQRRKELSSDG